MHRRSLLATAGAITLVLVIGTAAAATNMGLLDWASGTGPVGQLTPQQATGNPTTVIVDPAPAQNTSQQTTAAPAAPAASPSTGTGDVRASSEDDHGKDEHDEAREHGLGWRDDD